MLPDAVQPLDYTKALPLVSFLLLLCRQHLWATLMQRKSARQLTLSPFSGFSQTHATTDLGEKKQFATYPFTDCFFYHIVSKPLTSLRGKFGFKQMTSFVNLISSTALTPHPL